MTATIDNTEDATLAKVNAEIARLIADTAKINQETRKTRIEATLYPFIAGAAFFGAIAAFAKIFL